MARALTGPNYSSRGYAGAEAGHHHHVAGPYLLHSAQEAAWREDNRRCSNGEQVRTVASLAMGLNPSVDFCGCKHRHIRAEQTK
jgi:hypothetical protein